MAGRSTGQVTHTRTEASAGRATQTLWGVVLDPSGAVVPNAALILTRAYAADSLGFATTTQTDGMGRYVFSVAPGTYGLTVRASGFAEFQAQGINLQSRWPGEFDVRLKMETQLEQVDVLEDASGPHGAGAVVLLQKDIQQLPIDPAALLDELQSLAGGPGAELYVEGFSGVKLPPRSQIREIRINQNPYSAQNDVDPMSGTIQVLTRPGADRLHGDFYILGDLSQLNARNPFTPDQAAYSAFQTESTLSGMIRPRASYFADYSQIENRLNSLMDAGAIAASGQVFPRALETPLSTIEFSPRLDLQPAAHSTLSLRYAFNRTNQSNGGVGQLALSPRAYDSTVFTHTLQLSNSQTLGDHAINDTRLQYLRQHSTQTPASVAPAIAVQGVFSSGGSPFGFVSDHLDKLELQNYVALAMGRHSWNIGGRLRTARDANRSTAGFNGEFIFSSLADYQGTANRTGYSASEFVQTTGDPRANVEMTDAALFAQDDWKATPGLTLSYGLRVEGETFISDHIDLAPRVGFSKAFGRRISGKPGGYTLHGGAGVFYRRFPLTSALTVTRENGVTEQQYVVPAPRFFAAIPERQTLGVLSTPTAYRISPRFRTPYYIGTGLTLDRQLGRKGLLSVSWLYNRGVHTELIENVNTPLPGTYTSAAPALGLRPLATQDNVYEFASDGIYRSTRISTTLNLRPGRFSLYCFYTARFDTSDAESGSFPSTAYNLGEDYGRANDDIRHMITVRGAADLPRGFSISSYVHASSGAPFNIVLSRDANGDTQFNDRPAFATDLSRSSVVMTRWGAFDTDPQPGQRIIPRNLGEAPGFVLVDLALGKSFGIGPEHKDAPTSTASGHAAGSHGRPATLDFLVESQNLLNHPNLTAPIGILGSPQFGKSIAVSSPSALSGDRIVNLVLSIRF
ncbi:MAG: TonB-dependent receptor [Acidobacteriaceae bacterium]